MKFHRLFLFLVLAVLLNAALSSSPTAKAEPAADRVLHVEVVGDTLYTLVDTVGGEAELRVYDVSDAMAPAQLGSLPLPGDWPGNLDVSGDFAYMSVNYEMFDTGLWVVDVSDPANPTLLDDSLAIERGVSTLGRYLYMLDSATSLSIYRVDDSGHPQLVSSLALPSDDASTAIVPSATEDDMDEGWPVLDWPYLYPAESGTRVNVSDPANPVLAGQYEVPLPSSVLTRSSHLWSVWDDVFFTIGFHLWAPDSDYSVSLDAVDGTWHVDFFGAPVQADWGPDIRDYDMAWGRYLFVSAADSFAIYDLLEFSMEDGYGNPATVYEELSGARDAEYHFEKGVFYLARDDDGLDVIQAPFPTPTLEHHVYFPVGLQ